MVGDNDAGGVSTYSQAGQNYGTSLLWVLLLLIPVLIVNQEMVVRLGAVTGVGHARLINERFGRFWGWFSVDDLFVLNFLTIVTEFIGVSLALGYFGVSQYVAVPIAAVALVAITASGSFRSWERSMFVFVFANLLVIPLVFLSHPNGGPIVHDFVVPGIQGGVNSTSVLLIIAIVGTTVAPWQLFFQQSNIVDKRITPRWINYERVDTCLGAIVVVVGAAALMCVSAFAFAGTPYAGHFTDAGDTARGLEHVIGPAAGAIFAIVLLNASLIGAGALTLSTSYAFGDMFGTKSSLHRTLPRGEGLLRDVHGRDRRRGGDRAHPGRSARPDHRGRAGAGRRAAPEREHVPAAALQRPAKCSVRGATASWLNVLATLIVAVLVLLSLILMATTVFPSIDVTTVSLIGGALLAVGLLGFRRIALRSARRRGPGSRISGSDALVPKEQWTMPPLALLARPRPRRTQDRDVRDGGLLLLAVALLIVKAVELAGG